MYRNKNLNYVTGWDGGVAFVPVICGALSVFGYVDKPLPYEENETAKDLAEDAGHRDRIIQGRVVVKR